MPFKSYCKFFLLIGLVEAVSLMAQMAPVVTIAPQPTVKAKRGTPATVTLKVSLPAGFHMNSNTPTDANLIPLTLKWTAGPLEGGVVTYPKPLLETYAPHRKLLDTAKHAAGSALGPAEIQVLTIDAVARHLRQRRAARPHTRPGSPA